MSQSGAKPAKRGVGRRMRRATLTVVAALGIGAVAAPAALADLQIESFDARVEKRDGTLETRAGAHPYAAKVSFRTNKDAAGGRPLENARNIRVSLPAGFVGNPQSLPMCSRDEFINAINPDIMRGCAPETQVGAITIVDMTGMEFLHRVAIFNVEPRDTDVADFAFIVAGVPIHLVARVRSDSDYGLDVDFSQIPTAVPFAGADVVFWGQPMDPEHDVDRDCDGGAFERFGCASTAPPRPLLSNPSVCGPRFNTLIRIDSWEDPGDYKTAVSTTPTPATNCENLRFEPRISIQPDTRQIDSPMGMTVEIDVPQNDDPEGIATPPLRKAVVTLPPGVSISPSSADGLGACSDEQLKLGSLEETACPDSSRIGSVTLDTPLLGVPLNGDIILRSPQPGNLFRLALVLRGRGLLFKLPGDVVPDKATGQITATFDNNPQLPFSKLRLVFKSGPRAPLATPLTCGPAATNAALTPWGIDNASATGSAFDVSADGNGAPCSNPFAPGVEAGVNNAKAGADSSFALTISRPDGHQFLNTVNVKMPKGLLGRVSQVPLCNDGIANAGQCGPASRVGSVTAAAGPGSNPFYLPGDVYFTGPYKGAPFGLSIVVRAIAGPFDLGTVVVRAAVFVDPETAELRVVSDPLPQILEGVVLRMRKIHIAIDRPGFMFNPTACKTTPVVTDVGSIGGAVSSTASRFATTGCKSLPFAPRMSISVGARGATKRGQRTPLTVVLTQGANQVNNRIVQVTLPLTLNARLDIVSRACTLDQYKAGNCEAGKIGNASVITPLLKDPLTGSAYFVRNPRYRIPNIVVALRGQVSIDLTGIVTVTRSLQLRTRFETVPDVPMSRFRLSLQGGREGVVGVVKPLCSTQTRRSTADVMYRTQNGKVITADQRLRISGCKAATRPATRRAATRRAGRRATRRASKRGSKK